MSGADRRLDVAGATTVTGSLILAVYAIVDGNAVGWTSARTLGLLAAAAALAAAFAVVELRVGAPLVSWRASRTPVTITWSTPGGRRGRR